MDLFLFGPRGHFVHLQDVHALPPLPIHRFVVQGLLRKDAGLRFDARSDATETSVQQAIKASRKRRRFMARAFSFEGGTSIPMCGGCWPQANRYPFYLGPNAMETTHMSLNTNIQRFFGFRRSQWLLPAVVVFASMVAGWSAGKTDDQLAAVHAPIANESTIV